MWPDGLMFKLKQNGISGRLLSLLENYLQNRKQRVVRNASHFDYPKIDSGVPQGSVLGSLLFLIYINDPERNISSNIKCFADDIMLFSIVKDPVISANDLNHDLDITYQWAYRWKMEFNPGPTKHATEILFSCKKSCPNHHRLIFNGTDGVNGSEHKHLGLILEPGLLFEKHLSEKISKAVGILKHLSKFLPLTTLGHMYKALVRPHRDYCDVIYHLPSKINLPPLGRTLNSLMEKVERIQ